MNGIAANILLNIIRPTVENQTGRPRVLQPEYILDRIMYILRTGCQWANLPVNGGSWKTVYHYFSLWSKRHFFERAYHNLLQFYLRRRGLSQHVVVDTSFVKNVFGRDCLGKSPVDRGRKATKVSALVDAFGTPLHLLFHPGNKNDGKTLRHMLDKAVKHIDLRGLHLYGDKGYDSERCRSVTDKHHMINRVTRKGTTPCKATNRTRIVVEHTFGWLDKYRRIIMRYDGLVCHFRSFHFFASMLLTANRLHSI